jgi:polyketide cyclase/dehydrase/lipid transport protein
MHTRLSVERLLDAPADLIYHLLADYTQHHSPARFLPPAFSDQIVEAGGFGAGTRIRLTITLAGRRQTMTAAITEPEPGRVLVETARDVCTTFTVEPHTATQTRVRFDSIFEARGVAGLLAKLLVPRMLRPIYLDEMARLERYAQTHVTARAEAAGQVYRRTA